MNTHLDALKEQELYQSGTALLPIGGDQTTLQPTSPRRAATTNAVPNATNYTQGIHNAYAGTCQGSHQATLVIDSLLVPFPTSIRGTCCYTDASTMPDLAASAPRHAGLGIFIINTDVQPHH